jgi:glycerol-1-phosphate dehydrogenase [NAD(P)+]
VADDHTRDLILEEIGTADLYIAVGSGVINDLVKWTAYLRKKPYIVVATAASMNGYASANVAATIEGLKVLFHAEAARAVIAEPGIIMTAPCELSTAGLGDVLAKSVSSADWKVNHFLFQEYYCPFAVNLLKDLEPVYLEHPGKIKNREPDGFTALFKALFFSSIAMTITGTSAPASGGEHLVSHTLDILAGRDEQEHDLHGRQVGVSSILMAALYEKLVSIEQPRFHRPPQEIDRNFWGSLSGIVEAEYDKKKIKMEQAADILSHPAKWKGLKTLLIPDHVPAAKLKSCLQKAGAAHRYSDLRLNRRPLEREFFVTAVNHANQMRERFTILDLAVLMGIIPNETETLIDQWLSG